MGKADRIGIAIVAVAWMAVSLQGCFKKLSSGTQVSWTGPLAAKCSRMNSHGHQMNCGSDVEVCGVLTLETGEGKGNYQHPEPVVHGLWPQTSGFGNSECDRPDNSANPTKVYPCFDTQGSSSSAVWFQKHEWEKHGVCAGVKNADDFFKQVCQLSSAPLQVMAGARAANMDLVDMADQLQRAGFCVYHVDSYNKQLQLSACQDAKGLWHLADVNSFSQVCGAGSSGGGGGSASSKEQCIQGQRGPRCTSDNDCMDKANCQRCARSGYCTNVPLRLWSFEGLAFPKEPSGPFIALNVTIMTIYLAALAVLLKWRLQRTGESITTPATPLISEEPQEQ